MYCGCLSYVSAWKMLILLHGLCSLLLSSATTWFLTRPADAVQIAAIFEFGGALLLGRVITDTIAGKKTSRCQESSSHAQFPWWACA